MTRWAGTPRPATSWTAHSLQSGPDSPTVEVLEEVLPHKYSDMNKSELRLTVVPGENEANFELHSDKKK